MFVKAFDAPTGQIAIFRPTEVDVPCLHFYFEVNGIVTSLNLTWEDSKEGWESRDAAFEHVNEGLASQVISYKYNSIVEIGNHCKQKK